MRKHIRKRFFILGVFILISLRSIAPCLATQKPAWRPKKMTAESICLGLDFQDNLNLIPINSHINYPPRCGWLKYRAKGREKNYVNANIVAVVAGCTAPGFNLPIN